MSVAKNTTPKSHRTSVRKEVRGSESPRSGAGPESPVVRCMLTCLPHDDSDHAAIGSFCVPHLPICFGKSTT